MVPLRLCFAAGAALVASAALAQEGVPPSSLQTAPPPAPVAVESLDSLDLFSIGGEGAGLGPDLWRRSSGDLARIVLPLLAAKPLSPAFAAFGRRVLATPASGPEEAGADPEVAAERAAVLTALGGAETAASILSRTNGVDRSAALSQAAAEAALLLGRDDQACAIGEALRIGREAVYWLRLRAYCQAVAGQPAAAQLTLDLAEAQAKDPVTRRLVGRLIAGEGDPGKASLRGGLDYALSRRLGLDLAAASPAAPAVALVLAKPPQPPAADASVLGRAAEAAASGDRAAALIHAGLGGDLTPHARAELAGVDLRQDAPAGRLMALDRAVAAKARGDVALLALWIAADAGPAGPGPGDRARILSALLASGFVDDARAIAAEGLGAPR